MAESKEELKSLLMKVKEEKKSWLKIQCSKNEDHGIQSHHFMANRSGKKCKQWETLFLGGLQISLQMVTATLKLKDFAPWKKSYDQPREHIKKTLLCQQRSI